jgi:hypothetical protein
MQAKADVTKARTAEYAVAPRGVKPRIPDKVGGWGRGLTRLGGGGPNPVPRAGIPPLLVMTG